MITKIKVFCRWAMDDLFEYGEKSGFPFCNDSWDLVSIHGDSKQYLTPDVIEKLKKSGMKKHLSQEYWDVPGDTESVREIKKHFPKCIFFSMEQAVEVVRFLEEIRDGSEDILVCHCDAGIKRSGAVAVFACEFLGLSYTELMLENPNIFPNKSVLNMLRKAGNLSKDTEFIIRFEEERRKKIEEAEKLLDQYGHCFI